MGLLCSVPMCTSRSVRIGSVCLCVDDDCAMSMHDILYSGKNKRHFVACNNVFSSFLLAVASYFWQVVHLALPSTKENYHKHIDSSFLNLLGISHHPCSVTSCNIRHTYDCSLFCETMQFLKINRFFFIRVNHL